MVLRLGLERRRKYQPLEKELGDQLELQEPLLLLFGGIVEKAKAALA